MQKIPINNEERVETGPVQFVYKDGSEDWPSLLIRGDDCSNYQIRINTVLKILENVPDELKLRDGAIDVVLATEALKELRDRLHSVDLREIEKGG